MKPLTEITFGFSDAENYRRRENRDLFNKIFLHNDHLAELCRPNVFFLLGEKGTGKTAYAVYFSNSKHNNNNSIHKFIRETDYQKFISLKQRNNLSLSDYTSIWKVICYLLLSDAIYRQAGTAEFLLRYKKFKALRDAIDEYYKSAFSPEIPTALQFVENSEVTTDIILKHLPAEAGAHTKDATTQTTNKSKFQTNLLLLEKKFEECLSSIRLSENFVLFVDGVDIRPSSIPYPEYLDCVKGLANSIWSLNNDFFPSVKDSKGRLRVVLLVRPDIYNSLGLQNRNTKLKDNSLVLDWRTTYPAHRESDIFRLADRLFAAQQSPEPGVGDAWDHYFPFNAASLRAESTKLTSFVVLLRYSFYRPRDILTILDLLNRLFVRKNNPQSVFTADNFFSSEFKKAYGDYLLGEIKDSLSFYYNEHEFETFLKFFEFLDGARRFDYDKYLDAHRGFSEYLQAKGEVKPTFMRTPEEFLQFLYDLNIICFFEHAEDELFLRWCFQERSVTNISPKVKTEAEYEIHYGLANVLNTGKALIKRRSKRPVPMVTAATKDDKSSTHLGKIKFYNAAKKFGFIVQENLPVDIFFSARDALADVKNIRSNASVKYELAKDRTGRLVAKKIEMT